MPRRKKPQADRLIRLREGRCPVHGIPMSQVDRFYTEKDPVRARLFGNEFTFQMDRRKDCDIIVRAYGIAGPFELVAKWHELVTDDEASNIVRLRHEHQATPCTSCSGEGVTPCTSTQHSEGNGYCRICYGHSLAVCGFCYGTGETPSGVIPEGMTKAPADLPLFRSLPGEEFRLFFIMGTLLESPTPVPSTATDSLFVSATNEQLRAGLFSEAQLEAMLAKLIEKRFIIEIKSTTASGRRLFRLTRDPLDKDSASQLFGGRADD